MSKGQPLQKFVCRCPRIIRVAPATFAQGTIDCSVCSHPFEPEAPR